MCITISTDLYAPTHVFDSGDAPRPDMGDFREAVHRHRRQPGERVHERHARLRREDAAFAPHLGRQRRLLGAFHRLRDVLLRTTPRPEDSVLHRLVRRFWLAGRRMFRFTPVGSNAPLDIAAALEAAHDFPGTPDRTALLVELLRATRHTLGAFAGQFAEYAAADWELLRASANALPFFAVLTVRPGDLYYVSQVVSDDYAIGGEDAECGVGGRVAEVFTAALMPRQSDPTPAGGSTERTTAEPTPDGEIVSAANSLAPRAELLAPGMDTTLNEREAPLPPPAPVDRIDTRQPTEPQQPIRLEPPLKQHRTRVPKPEATTRIREHVGRLSGAEKDAATRNSIAAATGVSQGLTSAILNELGIETVGKRKGVAEPQTRQLNPSVLAALPAPNDAVSDSDAALVKEALEKCGVEKFVELATLLKEDEAERAKQDRRHECRAERRHSSS